MIIYEEKQVTDFENDSWCCEDFWDKIHEQHLENALDSYMEDIYPEGLEKTALNDILRFDGDDILEAIGYEEEDEDENEDEDEEEED